MTAVRVMVPIKITPSMLLAGTTVPEPNTANGEVYATHRSCVLQITLSLYAGLLDDLNMPAMEMRQAA